MSDAPREENRAACDTNSRAAERGNAIFLILVAISLFAALAYVVMGGGGGGGISEKDVQMAAYARLTQFPPLVAEEVKKKLDAGADVTQLDFSFNGKGKDAVFEHLQYQSPGLAIGGGIDWKFTGIGEKGEGWFVSGIGGNGRDGKDVFAYLDGLTQENCEHINKALGLSITPLTEANTVDLNTPGGPDAEAGNNNWSFNAHNATTPPDPQTAACVRNGNTQKGAPKYSYYHVIVAK